MSNSRGISCSQCSVKIDRYDDSICCSNCEKTYHIKCVKLSVEGFNKIRENPTNKWICEACRQPKTSDVGRVKTGNSSGSIFVTKETLAAMRMEIVSELSTVFLKEIDTLKTMLESQSKQIQELKKEICVLSTNKNVIAETADMSVSEIPHIGNSVAGPSESHAIQSNTIMTQKDKEIAVNNRAVAETNGRIKNDVSSESSQWTLVTSGKKKKRNHPIGPASHTTALVSKNVASSRRVLKPIVGTSTSSNLKVVPKEHVAHLHVSRLSPSTTNDELKDFFGELIPNVTCEKLISRRPEIYSSFKVTLPAELLQKVLDPNFWPEGVAVNKFFMKRRQSSIAP